MKIEDFIKLSEDAMCEMQDSFRTLHVDPKSWNNIFSWYNEQGSLRGRETLDQNGNGFGIYQEDDKLLWLYFVKKSFDVCESEIAIGRSESNRRKQKKS